MSVIDFVICRFEVFQQDSCAELLDNIETLFDVIPRQWPCSGSPQTPLSGHVKLSNSWSIEEAPVWILESYLAHFNFNASHCPQSRVIGGTNHAGIWSSCLCKPPKLGRFLSTLWLATSSAICLVFWLVTPKQRFPLTSITSGQSRSRSFSVPYLVNFQVG